MWPSDHYQESLLVSLGVLSPAQITGSRSIDSFASRPVRSSLFHLPADPHALSARSPVDSHEHAHAPDEAILSVDPGEDEKLILCLYRLLSVYFK